MGLGAETREKGEEKGYTLICICKYNAKGNIYYIYMYSANTHTIVYIQILYQTNNSIWKIVYHCHRNGHYSSWNTDP